MKWLVALVGVLALTGCGGDIEESGSGDAKLAAIKACSEALDIASFGGVASKPAEVTPLPDGGQRVEMYREQQLGPTCPALYKGSCTVKDGSATVESALRQDGYVSC